MKLTFLGVSSALSDGFNSNMLLDLDNGQTLLIDCGDDIKLSLKASNRKVEEIDAIYISHLHADHCFGLSWLGYYSYFITKKKITLYIQESMISDLWSILRPAMDKLDNKLVGIDTYFDLHLIDDRGGFYFANEYFDSLKRMHVKNKNGNMYSYALYCPSEHLYISTDTTSIQGLLEWSLHCSCIYEYIFQDVDVMNLSGVHANYNDLKKIKKEIKKQIWLYHYTDLGEKMPDAVADGFAGFVKEGQIFKI